MEQKKSFIINAVYYGSIGLLIWAAYRYLFAWLLPAALGLIIAVILNPAIMKLSKSVRLKRKLAAVLCVVIFYLFAGSLIAILITWIVQEARALVTALPVIYHDSVLVILRHMYTSFSGWLRHLSPKLADSFVSVVSTVSADLSGVILSLSKAGMPYLSGFALSLPTFLLNTVLTVVFSAFIAIDYEDIRDFIARQLPPKARAMMFDTKGIAFATVSKFIRAYSFILLITFCEVAAGLLLLRVKYWAGIAAIVAFLDLLPVLGTGIILVPWGIFELVSGSFGLGVGLLILYAVVTVVRGIIEPRIVGRQTGLHPVVMLLCIVLGARFLGFFGIIILPITVIVLKKYNDQGKIKLWK